VGIGPLGPAPFLAALSEQDREQERQERDAQRRQMERDREIQFYDQGTNALDEGRWDRAVSYFDRVIALKGTRVDASLYWKAYAQNKQGQRAEALSTIAELIKTFPASRYLKQAKALEVEVRNASGQPVRPEDQSDEELKLIALSTLQHTDPEQAVPMIEKLLEGTASPRLKSRALFVLAQSNSPRAREVLRNIARGSSTPELQVRAIQYLGVHGGRESRAVLAEIYASSTDVDVKRRILRAFMAAGEKDRVFSAAQNEKDPDLRREAVGLLGAMGAQDELWQLYQKESAVDVKKQIIQAMFVSGNVTRMVELARTEQNAELRRTAVRGLGQMGSKGTGDALVQIYASDKDESVRKMVINALAMQDNAAGLVALARKEQDIAMKKAIVERLSHMGGNKIATDYLLEILNK
jgi:HEAT repeat protein